MDETNTSRSNDKGWAKTLEQWFADNQDACAGNAFMSAFRTAICRPGSEQSTGGRTRVSSAIEAGLDSMFTIDGWVRESGEFDWTGKSGNRHLKVVDRKYVKGAKCVALEVKSTLEFNALAAALVEGKLLQHKSPNTKFGVVSLCAKGKVTTMSSDLAAIVCPGSAVMVMVPERAGADTTWHPEDGAALAIGANLVLEWARSA